MEMSRPTALITGCSQGGIGDALARQLASRGYHVFATVRNPSKAAHYAEAEDIEVVQLDVTSSTSIDTVVGHLRDRLPEGKLENSGQQRRIRCYRPLDRGGSCHGEAALRC